MSNDENNKSATNPSVSVVVPAFDEAEGIKAVLDDLTQTLPAAELIVVDDGSSDGTGDIASQAQGVRVIRHPINRGYGAALKTGMSVASGELIAWMDADDEHSVEELNAMLQRFDDPTVSAVLGERSSSTGHVRALGKLLLRILLWSLQAGTMVHDLNCGLRAFRRECILPYLSLLPDGYSASMTSTVVMIERRYALHFHPVSTRRRRGHSKVRVRHGFVSLVMLLRMIMLFAPLRIFLTAGTTAILTGLAYGLGLALVSGRGFSTLAGTLTLSGVLTIFMGLIADQVSQLRLILLHESRVRVETLPAEPKVRPPP